MRIALLLSKYFPHGGMQRDFLAIAGELGKLGHHCTVYCQQWQGAVPDNIELRLLPVSGATNHRRMQVFLRGVQSALAREPVDGVVGFEKMPGLDVCFVPDECFVAKAAREHGSLYRLTPRYRHFSSWERAVFGREASARILTVSAQQRAGYEAVYDTQSDRLFTLPPGVDDQFGTGTEQRSDMRIALRKTLRLQAQDLALLFVGSAFASKGLDRAVTALAKLPEPIAGSRCRMFIVGADRPGRYEKLARRLDVAGQVEFLGARDDVPACMAAADLLVHPARTEAGGTVLLEALAAGLPVITTQNCGHARHISAAGSGIVLPTPFEQVALDAALRRLSGSAVREPYRRAAEVYVEREDFYSMHSRAATLIEEALQATPGHRKQDA